MINFSISTQIKKEIDEFNSKRLQLAKVPGHDTTIRYIGKADGSGYSYNQAEMINLIDLYWNSKFETGERDKLGQRKIFMNVGKFRTEVAAKQIDLDVKDFRFLPDDYADPWVAFFMQKEFKEWTKESYFGEILNQCVENFPKYGTVVLKKVGKKVKFMPLQLLRNDQTAESLQTASYVIEEHPDMTVWELQEMKAWNLKSIDLKYDKKYQVYERYGYVPLSWLKKQNGEAVQDGDDDKNVDAMVIVSTDIKAVKVSERDEHVLYCEEVKDRPYLEAHWIKQWGRWLGCGTMEDLLENQRAKNIIINLYRRSLNWSSKRVMQSNRTDALAKNLVKDVEDGEILDVGVNGEIKPVDLSNRNIVEFNQFLSEWEKNADQKAFTYDMATGQTMPSGTPVRLGVMLSNAIGAYFDLKREKLGLFLKQVIIDFMIPEFIKNLSGEERIIAMFSDEPGFDALKEAAMEYTKSEAAKASLLQGVPVDTQTLIQAIEPMQAIKKLFFTIPADYYKTAKYKFDLSITQEEVDVAAKITALTQLYQALAAKADSRADKVLDRIMALSGENVSVFGAPKLPAMGPIMPNQQTNAKPTSAPAGGQQPGA
jgi:hypothetical protein